MTRDIFSKNNIGKLQNFYKLFVKFCNSVKVAANYILAKKSIHGLLVKINYVECHDSWSHVHVILGTTFRFYDNVLHEFMSLFALVDIDWVVSIVDIDWVVSIVDIDWVISIVDIDWVVVSIVDLDWVVSIVDIDWVISIVDIDWVVVSIVDLDWVVSIVDIVWVIYSDSSSSSLGSRCVPWLGEGLSMPSPNYPVLCFPLPYRVAPVFV